jgi:O-antigen/teichoic acid export membrane protein
LLHDERAHRVVAQGLTMNLKQRIVAAVGWSTGIKVAFQLVTWAMTLMVIRILSPDDYGLMAVSQVFANFLLGFSALGLGDALVQRESTPKPIVASVFGMILLTSGALTILLALAAYPIGRWYADDRLIPLIQVSSLGFLLNGLTTLPRVFLMKSLQLRPMFIMELSSGLAGALTVIVLAYMHYGVWALQLGWLVSNVAKLLGFALLTSQFYVWPRFRLAGIGPLLNYGAYRTLEYTAWVAYSSADIFIISRWLGPTELGLYTVAMNFAGMPLNKIAPILNATAFPAFAMVQSREAEARFYALKSLRMMSTIAVPVFFGICATAPEIVDIVFGPNWLATKPILAVLALATSFRAILLLLPPYLQGIGDSRAAFWCTMIGLAVFPPAFLLGSRWGIMGVCYAWLAAYPLVYALNALVAARRGGLDMGAFLLTPVQPMVAGAVMIGTTTLLRASLPLDIPELVRFTILVAAGAAVYIAILCAVFRERALELLRLIQRPRPGPA